MPGCKMDMLLHLLKLHGDKHILFIEFWDIIEKSLSPRTNDKCTYLLRFKLHLFSDFPE